MGRIEERRRQTGKEYLRQQQSKTSKYNTKACISYLILPIAPLHSPHQRTNEVKTETVFCFVCPFFLLSPFLASPLFHITITITITITTIILDIEIYLCI